MSEKPDIELAVLKWPVNRTGAWIAIVSVGLLAAIMTLLSPHLTPVALASGIGLFATTTGIALWNGARAARSLRAKLSKLVDENRSLLVRASPTLNEVTDSDRVLIAVSQSEGDDARISMITGFTQIRVDDFLHRLRESGMIEYYLGGAWERNSHHEITDRGRSYLVDQHLVE